MKVWATEGAMKKASGRTYGIFKKECHRQNGMANTVDELLGNLR